MTNSTTEYPKESRFLRITDVIHRVGYKRTQIYQMIREGRFPKNFPIGPRAVAWDSNEIDVWMENQRNQPQR